MRLWIAVVVVLVVLIAALPWAPPVLWTAREPGAIDAGDVLFVIRNPLRSRAPERAADRLFRDLRAGKCESVLTFVSADVKSHYCDRERGYPVREWSVVSREDTKGQARIHYKTTRDNYGDGWSNVIVTVAREGERWRVVGYAATY